MTTTGQGTPQPSAAGLRIAQNPPSAALMSGIGSWSRVLGRAAVVVDQVDHRVDASWRVVSSWPSTALRATSRIASGWVRA